ncbi:MAG: hypothetical protein AAGG11_18885 [Pseudomonadota bacterium]
MVSPRASRTPEPAASLADRAEQLRSRFNRRLLGMLATLGLAGALGACSDSGSGADTAVATSPDTPAATSTAQQAAQPAAAPQLTYADQWGPAAGSPLPLLAASDHTGNARSLGDLSGKNGLLLFFNRSADW